MAHWRKVKGFTDIGAIRIPPLPQTIVLTDRATGTKYGLIHDSTGNFIGLDDAASVVTGEVVIYGAHDGPILSLRPTVRLLVRNGHLGYEDLPLPTGVTDRDNAPPLSRRGNESKLFEIKAGTGWVTGDVLAYEQTSLP